jgi:hypothetical protein
MKLASLVALWLASAVLRLAGTELPEILCGPGDNILKQLKGDTAQRLPYI